MIKTLADLQRTHEEYSEYYKEWKFLHDSYMGGHEYEEGEYLTKYVFENNSEYSDRIEQTPYDNHCRSIISLYNSFLFSTPPTRNLADLKDNPQMTAFLEDADMEGRSFDQFMRQVDITSSIFGTCWIVIDKPALQVGTAADELAMGIRPYAAMFSPINVLDWEFERRLNGAYVLSYLKVLENETDEEVIIKCFYTDRIVTYRGRKGERDAEIITDLPNPLGKVPAVICYNQRGEDRGIGISAITDVARLNRSIYNEHSELSQIIRLSNHPSLVKTASTQASAGAGAIIQVEENLDPGLKPYLLQPNAASLDGVRASIKDKIDAINRLAAVGSVRATETRTMSGVAIETEMRTLNAKLAEKGDELELTEEQIFELWCEWQAMTWSGQIKYPDSFNARDRKNDLTVLQQALPMVEGTPELRKEIVRQVAEILIEDPAKLSDVLSMIEQASQPQPAQTTQAQPVRFYPDGVAIDPRLPAAYQESQTPDQRCDNCVYYDDGLCSRWDMAAVRANYWCAAWQPQQGSEDSSQDSSDDSSDDQ